MDEDAAGAMLDRDRDVAADQVPEGLPGPLDRRLAPAMDCALGADLDFGVDEPAHRLPITLAEGGEEAADELVCVPDRVPLAPAELVEEPPRLVAEARVPDEAQQHGSRPQDQEDDRPQPDLLGIGLLTLVQVESDDH